MESFVNLTIITEEIFVKNNFLADGEFKIEPFVSREIGCISQENRQYYTRLIFELKNESDKPFPIDLKIALKGEFDLTNVVEEETDEFLKHQAVQILFPYLRTMVSNITSSAMMSPIVLPVIDVFKWFPD